MEVNGSGAWWKAAVVPLATLVGGALLTFFASWFWWLKKGRQSDAEKLGRAAEVMVERVNDLERQLALVNQTIVPISAAFQAILVKELTHFHTPVMDALMVKLGPPYSLTDEEERELIIALAERSREVSSLITESERDAATMLPMVIKRVKTESSLDSSALRLKVVALPREQQ